MKKSFSKLSRFLYKAVINSTSAMIISFVVIIWFAVAGPLMHFSHQWFFILEGFAISLTLIMTFVIEHTQRADTKAVHAKLDELLRKNPKTNKKKIGIERRYKGEK